MIDTLDPVVTEALRSWRVQLEAGIASAEALEMSGGLLRGVGRACFHQASARTAKGDGITTVLDALSPVLTPSERAILAAGWGAGRIEPTIDALVRQRELWRDARRRIAAKLMLPIATLVVAAFVAPLPMLFAEGGSIVMYFIYVAIPLVLASALAVAAMVFVHMRATARVFNADGTPVPASGVDKLLLSVPLIAYLERLRCLAEFGEVLSHLLGAGAPIVQALESTAGAVRNGCYREEIVRLSRDAAKGFSFSTSMGEEPGELWPREFTAAVTVGERAGELDRTLARLAKEAREAYTRGIEQFAEWLPRFIYGLVALFVIWNIIRVAMVYVKALNDAMPPGM
jgi:type IV pilus assembly protein PilC